MLTRELVESIKKKREAGMSDEQIHAILENGGYSEEDRVAAMEASYKDISALATDPIITEGLAATKKKKSWWPF